MPLNAKQLKLEAALLAHCKTNQGAAISVLNVGRAPNATTYRKPFCDAAADLVRLYQRAGIQRPVSRLSEQFLRHGIRSCRDSEMSLFITQYLYQKFLVGRLSSNNYIVLESITTETCPICNRRKNNLVAHIQAMHPDLVAKFAGLQSVAADAGYAGHF